MVTLFTISLGEHVSFKKLGLCKMGVLPKSALFCLRKQCLPLESVNANL